MKNPIKIWLLIITILIVALAVVILFVKPKTASGEEVSYFGNDADAVAPASTNPTTSTVTA